MSTDTKDEIKAAYIRLPKKLWQDVAKKNIETGDNLNALIVRLLTEYLKKSAK